MGKLLCKLGFHKWVLKATSYKHSNRGREYIQGKKCSVCGKEKF